LAVAIDMPLLVRMVDERVARTLPARWPSGWAVRSASVGDHPPWGGNPAELEALPHDVAVAFVVDWLNAALAQYSDGVSEDAREPYGGLVTIDGAVLRLRFGRLPRGSPDTGYLAAELEPIPIDAVVKRRGSEGGTALHLPGASERGRRTPPAGLAARAKSCYKATEIFFVVNVQQTQQGVIRWAK
jgi:hypothetical protein